MTGESVPFTTCEMKYGNDTKEPKFGFWDFVLSMIFLFSFFGCIYLYFQNKTFKDEIENQHLLIQDLSKFLKKNR